MNESVDKTGGPAFPGVTYKQIGDSAYVAAYVAPKKFAFQGMTLRDWFAGMALQGLCADTNLSADNLEVLAYNLADAMIRQRNK